MRTLSRLLFIVFALVLVTSARAAITWDNTPSGGAAASANIELIRDIGSGPTGGYVGLRFSNSTALANVYAVATVGGVGYALNAAEPATHFIGSLGAAARTEYWYLNIPQTSANGTFQVALYQGDPAAGGTLQGTSPAYVLRSADVDQAASANKVSSVIVNGGNAVLLGQAFDVVVCYDINSSNGSNVAVGPAAMSGFSPNNLRLLNTTVEAFAGAGCSSTLLRSDANQLYFAGVGNAGTQAMRATYRFTMLGATSTTLSPIVSARVGQYKYNSDFNVALSSYAVPAGVNRVSLAKSVNITESAVATTVSYTVTATNSGAVAATLDAIIDTLPSSPANAGYVAGSARFNGAVIPDPVISGQTLAFGNPGGAAAFTIPAGASRALTFQATLPGTNGGYVNRVTARIGANVIGSTEALGSAPATATTAIGPPSLTVTKSALTPLVVNGAAGTSAAWRITVGNSGSTAAGVKVSDVLPAGFTYASTTAVTVNGSALAASQYQVQTGGTPQWDSNPGGGFTIAGGQQLAIDFIAAVAPTVADGTHHNSASVTSTTAGTLIANFNGNAATSDDVVVTSAVLTTGKSTSTPTISVPPSGGSARYAITVLNSGSAAASGVRAADLLPAGFTYAGTVSVAVNGSTLAPSQYQVQTNGAQTPATPRWDTLPAGGFTINAGQSLVIVFDAAVAAGTAEGTYHNSVAVDASGPLRSAGGYDGASGSSEDVTVGAAAGVAVSGTVYADANHNAQRDDSENGIGSTLFAKLVGAASPGGPALQAASVDAVSGAYAFGGVAAGEYLIVLDDNATLADVAPSAPAGWVGTAMADGRRVLTVAASDVPLQDFGLFNGSKVTGRVFDDSGAVPNDGVQQSNEAGIARVAVRATDASGASTLDSTQSDGSGAYTLWLAAGAGSVRIVETNLAAYTSVGGSAGSTGGSYTRSSDTVAFSAAAGVTYSSVNFADVRDNALQADGRQTTSPGSAVFYAHRFLPGSGGSVSFNLAANTAGFVATLYRDSDCNGVLDAGEPLLANGAAIAATTGVPLCVIAKDSVPANAPQGALNTLTLSAAFSYANASPALQSVQVNTDATSVGAAGALLLTKSQSTPSALPGAMLAYTIAFTNRSAEALSSIRLRDATPAFTRFVSAACALPLPAGISACSVSVQPAAGAAGSIEWTLVGNLASAASGQVTFTVQVEQ